MKKSFWLNFFKAIARISCINAHSSIIALLSVFINHFYLLKSFKFKLLTIFVCAKAIYGHLSLPIRS